MNNNILITSAGKRVTLVRLFQAELQKLIPDAKVFTTDMVPAMAPAGHVSDGCFAVPRVTASDYMQKLQEICEQNKIGLIVPTIDTELLLLAQHKDEFLRMGVSILVSSTDFVQACRDKRLTADLLNTSLRFRLAKWVKPSSRISNNEKSADTIFDSALFLCLSDVND